MLITNEKRYAYLLISTAVMVLGAGCTAQEELPLETWEAGKFDSVACMGATLDRGGRCRQPNGRFTFQRCCELEMLEECIAETEECLGHVEDEAYAESCTDNSGTLCVSELACPAWIYDDTRTPHEIMRIDIGEQCRYVCEDWFPTCMQDAGSPGAAFA